ncbi:G-protein coupled receptors family 1 profile domain-containing protein [Plasmodiophora brassicae]
MLLSCAVDASTSVETMGSGAVLGSWATPYFVLGNASFDVAASALYVVGAGKQADSLPPLATPTIVAVDGATTLDYQGWADACARQAGSCRGVLVTNCDEPNRSEASWMFRSAGPLPFTTVPMVVMAPKQTSALLATFGNDGRHLLRMTSQTAPDPVLLSTWSRLLWVVAFVLQPILAAVAFGKLVAFSVDGNGRVRRAPLAPSFALTMVLLSGLQNAYFMGDIVFCLGQCTPFNFVKVFLQQVDVTWALASTLTITYILQQAYAQAGGVVPRWSSRARALLWMLSLAIIVAYDTSIVLEFATSIRRAISPISIAGVLLLYMLTFIAFVRQGSRVAALLLRCHSISEGDRLMRLRFAQRIVLCGVVGLLAVVLFTVLAGSAAVGNFALYWYVNSVVTALSTVQRIMEAMAFQVPPDNIVGKTATQVSVIVSTLVGRRAPPSSKQRDVVLVVVANPRGTSRPA